MQLSQSADPTPTVLDRLPGALLAFISAAICLLVGLLSLKLLIKPENIAPIWPANAVMIALLARLNRRRWHWVLLGQAVASLAANLAASIPFSAVCFFTAGNAMESLLGVLILTRLGTERVDFGSLYQVVRLFVAAGPVNAVVSVLVAMGSHLSSRTDLIQFWQAWGLANGVAMVTVVPALLSFRRPWRDMLAGGFIVEVLFLFGGFSLLNHAIFFHHMDPGSFFATRPLMITVPFMLWAALRMGGTGFSAAGILMAFFAIEGTAHRLGPFATTEPDIHTALNVLQLTFMAWTACGLTITSAVEENRRTLREVIQERERFRQLTEFNNQIIASVQDGIIVIDQEMRYRLWSPAMERMSGIPAQALLGKTPMEMFPFLKEVGIIAMLERAMNGETVSSPDFPYEVAETGRKGWGWQLMGPLRSADGNIIGVITTVREITERKEAQDSLALFRTLMDHSNEGINIVHPASGRILYANEKFCSQSGYTSEELLTMSLGDINPEMDSATLAEVNKELKQRGTKLWETVRLRKDGSTIPIEVSATYVQLDREYLVSSVHDITDRKRNEELLRQSQNRFEVLAEATFEGILMHQDGLITDCNQQLERMFGYERGEMIGMPAEAIIAPEDRQRVFANVKAGSDANMEHGGLRKDGSRIIVDGRGRTSNYSGGIVRITVLRDITDRSKMQEMAIQSEKMLSIGGLAAGMAHEINNPLAVMVQNAQVVWQRISSDSPQNHDAAARAGTTFPAVQSYMQDREILSMLQGIHSSGERAAAIVKNMLAFSRPGSTTLSPNRLNELIDQAIQLLLSDYELKKRYDLNRVEIIKEFDIALPAVPCHGSEMQQVLLNVLRNAVQASFSEMPDKVSSRIIVRTMREGSDVRIVVEDNGPGIPEAIRRRVFEPFFTTKSPGEGTGLGLFVSYFIVTQHHAGTMRVLPNPIGGSRFEIALPLNAKE